MKEQRYNNDTDVLIETYEIRIKNHKKELRKAIKLKKIFLALPEDTERINEINEEIVYNKESIEDYKYNIKNLKKLIKTEAEETKGGF